MAIRFHVGIDGGGTHTRARLASADRAVLGFAASGPSALGQGIEQAWKHIVQAVDCAFADAGLAPAPRDQCALGLGLAGANVRQRCEELPAPRAAVRVRSHWTLTRIRPCSVLTKDDPGRSSLPAPAASVKRCAATVCAWRSAGGDFPSATKAAAHGSDCAQCARRIAPIDGRAHVGPLVGAVLAVVGTRARRCWAGAIDRGRTPMRSSPRWCSTRPRRSVCRRPAGSRDALARGNSRRARSRGTLPLAVFGSIGQKLLPRFEPPIQARCVEPAGDSADGALRLVRQALSELGGSER